jgi:hypothetical protein
MINLLRRPQQPTQSLRDTCLRIRTGTIFIILLNAGRLLVQKISWYMSNFN